MVAQVVVVSEVDGTASSPAETGICSTKPPRSPVKKASGGNMWSGKIRHLNFRSSFIKKASNMAGTPPCSDTEESDSDWGNCSSSSNDELSLSELMNLTNKLKNISGEEQQNKKQVRFAGADDGNNKIQPTAVYEVERIEDAEQKAEMYSTRIDSKLKKKEAREYAHDYVRANRMNLHSIELLFDSPLKRRVRPGAPDNLTDVEAIKILTESEARGLEIRMSALMWKHQKYAQTSTLQRYKSLVGEGLTEDDTSYFLRSRCLQLNSCAAEMARSLAIGDEIEARKIFVEEGLIEDNRWV